MIRQLLLILMLLLVFAPTSAQEQFVNWLFYETQNCIQTMYDADTGAISTFVEGCYLRWSPNGEFYTFTRPDGIHIQTVAHNEIALYTEFSEKVIYHTPHWVTNNHLTVAAADSNMDACSWYILNITTQEVINLEAENNRIPCANTQLRLSPSRRYVIFSDDVLAGIYILDTQNWSGQYLENAYGATWSPNEDIVLMSIGEYNALNVYTMEISSGLLRQLTFNENNVSPVWSPTGNQIAYIENTPMAIEIHVVDLGTSEDIVLDEWPPLDCDFFRCIQWSINGRAILYWYEVDSEIKQGGVFVNNGIEGGCLSCPAIYYSSPDNCYQAYLSPEDNTLYVRHESEIIQLSETPANFSSLQWRPQPSAAKEC